ncbi:MAG: hypothetical protein D6742_06615 [Cyanobacteria bacterium J069]|nr:MAG: hypothetical protein D6742_06615 [Cyanobacteria bacterium J069]
MLENTQAPLRSSWLKSGQSELPGLSSSLLSEFSHAYGLTINLDSYQPAAFNPEPDLDIFSRRSNNQSNNRFKADYSSPLRPFKSPTLKSLSLFSRDWDKDRRPVPDVALTKTEGDRSPPLSRPITKRAPTARTDSLTGLGQGGDWVASTGLRQTSTPRTITESLSRQDARNPTRPNTYKDDYLLQSSTSGRVQIDLASSAFDAYLQVVNSRTGAIVAADDDSGPGTHARLTLTVQAGVSYIVRATSFQPVATGRYTLTLRTPDTETTTSGFNRSDGYGQVNAAAAVAQSLNLASFAPVADAGYSWSNNRVNAPEAWNQGYTGRGVVVAVVDTGVDYTHSDLDANMWRNPQEIAGNGIDDDGNGFVDDVRGWDFADGDNDPMDRNGHGTHVAGTIAAENNDMGITGVAYNAQIMPVKVLRDNGSGTYTSVAQGIRYAADNGADVINLSLGGGYSAEVAAAIEHAVSQGAIVVMAAGNEGAAQPSNPASLAIQWGLSVGAIASDGLIASFSNRAGADSRMQHVVAPGVGVVSTIPGDRYRSLSGTSMAAPHVAGVVALMRQANPNLTDSQVRQLITTSATRLSGSAPNTVPQPAPTLTFRPMQKQLRTR